MTAATPVRGLLRAGPAGRVRPLAITGAGAVTPAGLGIGALHSGGGTSAAPPPSTPPSLPLGDEAAGWQLPPRELRIVPEFSLADYVGRKGIRHVDRMTSFCLVAGVLALADAAGEEPAAGRPEPSGTGVVLGTSTGSIRSLAELAHDSLTSDRPYLVNPARFPNIVMNAAAGQLAIWNALRGVNATFAGGQLSSLYALRFARVAIGRGRAGRLLAGGVEELSAQSAWAWQRSGALAPGAALGEGCAAFVVDGEADPEGPGVLAQLLACEVRYCGDPAAHPRALTEGLADTVRRALARSGVDPADVVAVSPGAVGLRGLEQCEERAVADALGRPAHAPRRADAAGALGVSYSASGAMQLAVLLAGWQQGELPGGAALITSVGPDGSVGCLVVRGRGRSRR